MYGEGGGGGGEGGTVTPGRSGGCSFITTKRIQVRYTRTDCIHLTIIPFSVCSRYSISQRKRYMVLI